MAETPAPVYWGFSDFATDTEFSAWQADNVLYPIISVQRNIDGSVFVIWGTKNEPMDLTRNYFDGLPKGTPGYTTGHEGFTNDKLQTMQDNYPMIEVVDLIRRVDGKVAVVGGKKQELQ